MPLLVSLITSFNIIVITTDCRGGVPSIHFATTWFLVVMLLSFIARKRENFPDDASLHNYRPMESWSLTKSFYVLILDVWRILSSSQQKFLPRFTDSRTIDFKWLVTCYWSVQMADTWLPVPFWNYWDSSACSPTVGNYCLKQSVRAIFPCLLFVDFWQRPYYKKEQNCKFDVRRTVILSFSLLHNLNWVGCCCECLF